MISRRLVRTGRSAIAKRPHFCFSTDVVCTDPCRRRLCYQQHGKQDGKRIAPPRSLLVSHCAHDILRNRCGRMLVAVVLTSGTLKVR